MSTNRFDQLDLDEHPYGECQDCGVSLRDEAAASDHMKSSRHAVWVRNPGRQRRIDREVSWEVESAVDGLFERLYDLVEDDSATAEEIEKALGWQSFDGWLDYVNEAS